MCATCGCSTHDRDATSGHHHPHDHDHDHDHAHPHAGDDAGHRLLTLERDVLARNQALAERNRGWLAGRGAFAINLMSSPGAGKTTLLERTIRDLPAARISVIEGDQETERDAERIRAAGARAIQINTGAGCHLDASMVERALRALEPPDGSTLMIENVGNLVCPSLFDLGESARVVIASVAEGDDKPLKYPHMFRGATAVLLNKMDLLPHVSFDVEAFTRHARKVNPRVEVLPLSATRGEGLDGWYRWLQGPRA